MSEHRFALQEQDEDEGHEEVVEQEKRRCHCEHLFAARSQFREEFLVIDGNDRQGYGGQQERDRKGLEEDHVVHNPEEEVRVVEHKARKGQKP